MSLWSSIKKGVKSVGKFALGAVRGAVSASPVGRAVSAGIAQTRPTRSALPPVMSQSYLPAVVGAGRVIAGGASRVIAGAGRVITSPAGRQVAGGVVGGAAAQYVLDEFGNPVRKKRRRMNPCNSKALNRAARRMNAYMKQHKKVEQALRRACPPSVRRKTTRAPTCR